MRMYWRTPSYNLTRILLSIFLGVVFGLTYVSIDYTTYSGVNGGFGMVFITTLFIGVISFNSVLPLAAGERPSYYRERASQTYSPFWYLVGSTVAEIPFVFASTFVFTVTFYPFVGFRGNFSDMAYYSFQLSLVVLMNVYFGQFVVFATPRGLGYAQMANVPPVVLAELHKSSVTVQEFAEFMFHTKNGDIFKNTMIILAVILLYRALALLAFRFMNYQKK
ncbi:unnamed protein product [Aphanomyces euteiches]